MENKEKRVLIADSDAEFVSEIIYILEKNEYYVIGTAKDGIDAVSECIADKPNIVFLKKDLDFIDGIKVSACLREKGFLGIIILVSDDYSAEITQNAVSSGADGVITKPVTEKFLIPWLMTKLKRSREKRELFDEKNKLLSELEKKRMESETIGIIASTMKITIPEAKAILDKKAKENNMTASDVAKLIAGGTDNQ